MSVIRGTTIATPISRSAVADDTAVSKRPWSSKNTVDKLCPSFTESGSVVACEPVGGYPLEVAWETKNLIDPTEYMKQSTGTTLDGDVFTTEFTDGGIYVNRWGSAKHHPAGTYTVSVIPVSEIISLSVFVYDKATGDTVARLMNIGSTNGYKLTFTATEPFRVSIGGPSTYNNGGAYGTYSYKLQLEKGTTATAYEPYAETATITRCGKNLIDPVKASKSDDDNRTTLDGDVFTTNFNSGGIHINQRHSPWRQVYPAGTYTFTLIPMTEGVAVSLFVYASSNGASIVSNRRLDASNPSYTFTAGEKCIPCLGGISGSYGIHSYKLQLEAGSTATEYEPYKEAETFAPGEDITAWDGVNTIYADAGLVTVTGKADPVAIINKLCDKVEAMSATITALTGV